jgi:hypothetical protein
MGYVLGVIVGFALLAWIVAGLLRDDRPGRGTGRLNIVRLVVNFLRVLIGR